MEDAPMCPTAPPLSRSRVAADGQLIVPPDVLRTADLRPGDEVVFEPALCGFFVQSRSATDAEDAADRAALDAVRAEDDEPVDWAEVKRELNL
jgi:bifunctional DNA-binding transcriptional regulator/antitoxin component of YhaV-PrlF toxin-antitoxin module